MRTRTFRNAALLTLPLLAFAATACDDDDPAGPVDTITYETSFEEGLDGFTSATDGVLASNSTASASISDDIADSGDQSLEMTVDNNGNATLWVERPMLELEADTQYNLNVTFDFGTRDTPAADDWILFVDADPASPDLWADFDDALTDDTRGTDDDPASVTWDEKRLTVAAESGAQGMVYFAIGIRATTDAARSYYIDDLSVTATEIFSQ
jgi:hypothetical protein